MVKPIASRLLLPVHQRCESHFLPRAHRIRKHQDLRSLVLTEFPRPLPHHRRSRLRYQGALLRVVWSAFARDFPVLAWNRRTLLTPA